MKNHKVLKFKIGSIGWNGKNAKGTISEGGKHYGFPPLFPPQELTSYISLWSDMEFSEDGLYVFCVITG